MHNKLNISKLDWGGWRSFLDPPLRLIYPLAILNSMLMIVLLGVQPTVDMVSYVQAIDRVAAGVIDIVRTPCYPLFLWLCRIVAGSHFLMLAVVLQYVLFLVSIAFMWRAASEMLPRKIAIAITVFYAFFPCYTTWCNIIQTETLALVGMVMMTYALVMTWRKRSTMQMVHAVVWMAFLVFLRPSFIYLLPVMAVGGLLARSWREALVAWLGVAAVAGTLYGYMRAFERSYGVMQITQVSTVNNYYMMRQDGLIVPEVIADSALRAEVEQSIGEYGASVAPCVDIGYEGNVFIAKYGLPAVQQAVSASMSANRVAYAKKCVGRFYRASTTTLLASYTSGFNTLSDMTSPNMNMLYVFLLVYIVIWVVYCVRARRIARFSTLLLMLGVSNLIVAIVGAQAEWARLVLPSQPVYILMLGQMVGLLSVRLKPRGERVLV